MITNFIILLILNLFVVCGAFSKSPLMQFEAKSSDAVSAMKQAALALNVQVSSKILLHCRFKIINLSLTCFR
jgi:hypothetical protein